MRRWNGLGRARRRQISREPTTSRRRRYRGLARALSPRPSAPCERSAAPVALVWPFAQASKNNAVMAVVPPGSFHDVLRSSFKGHLPPTYPRVWGISQICHFAVKFLSDGLTIDIKHFVFVTNFVTRHADNSFDKINRCVFRVTKH